MAAPVSNGVLRTNLADMKIGDYIRWGYIGATSNVAGTFTNDPDKLASLTDSAGGFYFIKWKSGLLVADRAVQSGISAQSLNKAGYYTGGTYRCLSLDEVSDISNDDFNGAGVTAFSGLGKTTVTVSYSMPCILCQNIKNEPIAADINRNPNNSIFGYTGTSAQIGDPQIGCGRPVVACFLPAMEYVDNPKSTNIYY